jgi:hypothetical protein
MGAATLAAGKADRRKPAWKPDATDQDLEVNY